MHLFINNLEKSYRSRIADITNLIASIPEEKLGLQSDDFTPETHCHPIWTLGHLSSSAQAISEELQVSNWLPENWNSIYGQQSEPLSDLSGYLSKQELLDVLDSSVEIVCKNLARLTKDELFGPMPDERYRHIFPTLSHVLSEILIKHTSEHLRMLLIWEINLNS
jgi:hypothetical protein